MFSPSKSTRFSAGNLPAFKTTSTGQLYALWPRRGEATSFEDGLKGMVEVLMAMAGEEDTDEDEAGNRPEPD